MPVLGLGTWLHKYDFENQMGDAVVYAIKKGYRVSTTVVLLPFQAHDQLIMPYDELVRGVPRELRLKSLITVLSILIVHTFT